MRRAQAFPALTKKIKRKLFFNEFSKYSISCLQECYVTEKNANLWRSEWSGQFIYTPGTSNSQGLIILINRSFCCHDLTIIKINNRCLGITFQYENRSFLFIIYTPRLQLMSVFILLTNYPIILIKWEITRLY